MKTRYEDLCAKQMELLNDKLQTAYKDSEDPVNQRIEILNSKFETISKFEFNHCSVSHLCRCLFP